MPAARILGEKINFYAPGNDIARSSLIIADGIYTYIVPRLYRLTSRKTSFFFFYFFQFFPAFYFFFFTFTLTARSFVLSF